MVYIFIACVTASRYVFLSLAWRLSWDLSFVFIVWVSDGSWVGGHFNCDSSIGGCRCHQLWNLNLNRKRCIVTRHLKGQWKLSHLNYSEVFMTYVNGNFLWEGIVSWEWNCSGRILIDPLNAIRRASRRKLFSLDGNFMTWSIHVWLSCPLLRTLREMWFYVFSKMILAIKTFSTFRTNLKSTRKWNWNVKECSMPLHTLIAHLCF